MSLPTLATETEQYPATLGVDPATLHRRHPLVLLAPPVGAAGHLQVLDYGPYRISWEIPTMAAPVIARMLAGPACSLGLMGLHARALQS